MTITLDPQLEQRLRKAADSERVPVEQYVVELLERDVPRHPTSEPSHGAENLVELFADSPLKGLSLVFENDPAPVRDFSL